MRTNPPAAPQHFSGILVLTRPPDVPRCAEELEHLNGVEVHHEDPQTGKIIAVLESASFEEQAHLLRRVRMGPHVLLAELIYYRRDDEPSQPPSVLDESPETGRTGA